MRSMISAGLAVNRPPHIRLPVVGLSEFRWSLAELVILRARVMAARLSIVAGATGRQAAMSGILTILLLTASAAAADGPPLSGDMVLFEPAGAAAEAPGTSFTDAEGALLSLADFRGQLVLVNFWATWCGPCVREMPSLNGLQAHYADGPLTVLPLSQDRGGAKPVASFYESRGLKDLGMFLDPKGAVFRAFGGRGLPTSVLLDGRGRVLGVLEGHADWTAPEAVALIDYYVAKGAAAGG